MYICHDCGHMFSTPKQWIETHNLDAPPYEEWYGCPWCSGAYTEAYQCEYCGNWIGGDYIKIGDQRYCDDCYTLHSLGDE